MRGLRSAFPAHGQWLYAHQQGVWLAAHANEGCGRFLPAAVALSALLGEVQGQTGYASLGTAPAPATGNQEADRG